MQSWCALDIAARGDSPPGEGCARPASMPLRKRILEGLAITIAGPVRGAVRARLIELGASLEPFDSGVDDDCGVDWARSRGPLAGLVFDAAPAFGDGGAERLQTALQRTWTAIHAIAAGVLIPAGAGGRIALIAPSPGAGPHAGAARAALENLARTLSTEWARHAITTTAIAPGAASSDADLATLVAYLLSPAGGYFTGCRFDLGVVRPSGS